jgi:phosphate transport system permease protein
MPRFGVLPLVTGTALVSLIAMLVALPMGLMSAIYLSEYAGARVRRVVKPVLELLAGIPTVVYCCSSRRCCSASSRRCPASTPSGRAS